MDPLDLPDPLDPVDPLETLAWEKVVFRLSKTIVSLQKNVKLSESHTCSCFYQEKCDTPSIFNEFHIKSPNTFEVSHVFNVFSEKRVALQAFYISFT